MIEKNSTSRENFQQKWVSRRNLSRGAAGAVLGAGLLSPKTAHADDDEGERGSCALANPIPGGVRGLAPFGVFIHHNPLNPAVPLVNINDPSMGFSQGRFIGTDGRHHEGTFAFV